MKRTKLTGVPLMQQNLALNAATITMFQHMVEQSSARFDQRRYLFKRQIAQLAAYQVVLKGYIKANRTTKRVYKKHPPQVGDVS